MITSPVDPPDQTSDVEDPDYRAYSWDNPDACDERELIRADLGGVLNWMRADSNGRLHMSGLMDRVGGSTLPLMPPARRHGADLSS